MQFEIIDGVVATACTCPTATHGTCVHQQYFLEVKLADEIQAKTAAELAGDEATGGAQICDFSHSSQR